MVSKYKLTYFNLKGLAEVVRFLLSYMEEDFEDVRIDKEQWASMKDKSPFGKLPMLEEEGKKPMAQSVAIARYLGKKAGLAGKDDWENLQIDMIVDTIIDLRLPIHAFFTETNEDIKKAKKETYIKETLPFYMKKLDAVVKENGGYLANKKMSWADFLFASYTELLNFTIEVSDVTADYPNLQVLRQKIFDLPQMKKWIAKRPHTAY